MYGLFPWFLYILLSLFIFIIVKTLVIFRERGREEEREEEKHQCVFVSRTPPTGDLAWNPGVCPDWESNWQPLGLLAHAQLTEPQQPEQFLYILVLNFKLNKYFLVPLLL